MSVPTGVCADDLDDLAGVALFVAFVVAGYYNLTFVQLGLIDLGTRLVGLSRAAVSAWMAPLTLGFDSTLEVPQHIGLRAFEPARIREVG